MIPTSRTALSFGLALLLLGCAACSGGRASRSASIPAPTAAVVTPAASVSRTAIPTALPIESVTALPTPDPTAPMSATPAGALSTPAPLPAPPPIPSAPGSATPLAAQLPSVATAAVTYPAGWNLIAGPEGTLITGNQGPLYTLRAGDTAYEVVPSGTPLRAGAGYWAYFPQPVTETLPIAPAQPVTIALVQGGSVMIGDPGNIPLTFIGAGQVFSSYDPRSGYHATTVVLPGQGLWVYSFAEVSLTLNASSP